MSRVSDERPPTATTTVTTMSASPKRVSGKEAAPPEASSTTSSQREAQPILNAALSKTKGLLSTEVYKALESATADALALSSMMGTVGQPGPISSGASTIGGATGTVTDRQLRRKADSICRSLTELCIALADEAHAKMHASAAPAPREKDASSPTVVKGLAGVASQRRPSAVADQSLAKLNTATSPRSMTRLEERRTSMLAASALPSPRYAGSSLTPPSTTTTDVGRKSSLLLSRTRRAGTEEPPDEGRKSSLLRSRRAGTEEPPSVAATDEGRKTSLLLRGRRGTLGGNEADDEGAAGSPSLRAPSRAVTEVGRFREGVSPRYPAAQDTTALGSSALPRRRLVTSSLTSRLAAPSTAPGAGTVMSPRRFLDRSDGGDDKTAPQPQQAQQRHLSLGQTAMLNRAGSLNRRSIVSTLGAHNNISRDSTLTNASTTAQAGGYR